MVLSAMPRSSNAFSTVPTILVMVDHGVVDTGSMPTSRLADTLRLGVGAEVHVCGVQPDEGLACPPCSAAPSMKSTARRRSPRSIVDHPLLGQRTGILAHLLADLAEARIDGLVVHPRPCSPARRAGRTWLSERRVFRIVRQLRLLLGVQVVEVAVELIEAVDRRQELVAVAEMVLAELAGRVAERLQQFGDGRVCPCASRAANPARRPLVGRCAIRTGPVINDGATGGAALLRRSTSVNISAFFRHAVDVGCLDSPSCRGCRR